MRWWILPDKTVMPIGDVHVRGCDDIPLKHELSARSWRKNTDPTGLNELDPLLSELENENSRWATIALMDDRGWDQSGEEKDVCCFGAMLRRPLGAHDAQSSSPSLANHLSVCYRSATLFMPTLAVLISSFRGNPTIEILRNGEPWAADRFGPEHFSFGITKARMIRAALPVIEQFAGTRGVQPWPGQIQTVTDLTGAGTIAVQVTKHEEFENAAGNQVNQPYLTLTSGPTSIGLGLAKCQAVIFLSERIDEFLARNGQGPLVLP